MKPDKMYKKSNFFYILIVSIWVFTACETTKMKIIENPNNFSEKQASADGYINAIQVDFADFVSTIHIEGSEMIRIRQVGFPTYRDAYQASEHDDEWSLGYQNIISDARKLADIVKVTKEYHHLGMAQVLEAYVMLTLVDYFGDVPYSEAMKGAENFNPKVDKGLEIYQKVLALLDTAIVNLGKSKVGTEPSQDLFYNGNMKNWIKAANSLKLKAYVTARLVPELNSATEFDKIIKAGKYIKDNSEDFQFSWGKSNSNPDTRHPDYRVQYTASGVQQYYQANWLMNYMYNDKITNSVNVYNGVDPRMQYYFYRQVPQMTTSTTEKDCVGEVRPTHYPTGVPWCKVGASAYWGRDHGDNDGIPPDSQKRTAFGVYPAGGKFDDNTFTTIETDKMGAEGEGITPIMLASWVDIMQAEMALVAGNDANVKKFLQSAITKSFQKVRSFGARDLTADLTQAISSGADDLYVQEVGAVYDGLTTTDAKFDLLGSEYFVMLVGNGIDGFNFFRRTGGKPSTIQAAVEPTDPGGFIRSFFYPSRFVNRNSSTKQKGNVATKVFWDTFAGEIKDYRN